MESVQVSMIKAILDMPQAEKSAAVRLLTGRTTPKIMLEVTRQKFLRKIGKL
jgi:hypothetical protein